MPWTFAHPAAVIPLRRYCPEQLNFYALVVGSVTPDLGYHLRMMDLAWFAHSFEGSLIICLPTGLLLLAVLYLLRKPIWYLLPEPHRSAFAPVAASRFSARPGAALAAGVSVLLGAWTHIAWDSLTHRRGWIALRVPLLQETWFKLGATEFPVFHVLQYVSSCLGVAVVVVAYWRWLKRARDRAAPPYDRRNDAWRYFLLAVFAAAATLIALILALDATAKFHGYFALRQFAFRGAVDGVSAFVVLYVLASIFCYCMRRTE